MTNHDSLYLRYSILFTGIDYGTRDRLDSVPRIGKCVCQLHTEMLRWGPRIPDWHHHPLLHPRSGPRTNSAFT